MSKTAQAYLEPLNTHGVGVVQLFIVCAEEELDSEGQNSGPRITEVKFTCLSNTGTFLELELIYPEGKFADALIGPLKNL
jgi:hypothetical protein